MQEPVRIVIVGAGFGGIRAALDLAARRLPNATITLVSDKPHFEYHAALYRVVTGRSPLEVCVSLREIFAGKNVDVVEDRIEGVNLAERTLMGSSGSRYACDYLVLALGSETAYFGIPGLPELSFGFKTIPEALRLKAHLHDIMSKCEASGLDEKVCATHIVVVGGGASGAELAGELAVYLRAVAVEHGLDPTLITIDLIEAAPRLLPALPQDISRRAYNRLHRVGVNIFLNRAIVREEIETVHLKDMQLKTKTLIWTAGVTPNRLYREIAGLALDKKNRVIVNEFLESAGFPNVFVIGDAAATPFAGMAQTAIRDGRYAAYVITRRVLGLPAHSYVPKPTSHAIPLGGGWAAVRIGSLRIYGRLGWWLRRAADLRYFLSILPFGKALTAWRSHKTLCESCSICLPEEAVARSKT